MKFTIFFLHCYFLFSMLHEILSLKCRTGNQQSDDQLQKIMQVCRRRYLGYNDRDGGGGGGGREYGGRDTDSQESSDSRSEEDLLDGKFLGGGGGGGSGRGYSKNSEKMSGGRYDHTGSGGYSRNATRQFSGGRNWSGRSGSYGGGNRSPYDDGQSGGSGGRGMRNGGSGDNGYSSNRYNGNRNGNGNGNGDDNNDGEREQACVVQCFFNELNLVDQKGFPERSSVISIMTQNLQDPELRDFVEESVIECFRYLNNSGRQEKCQFSQNLLSCLADKGSERCEDWDDE